MDNIDDNMDNVDISSPNEDIFKSAVQVTNGAF